MNINALELVKAAASEKFKTPEELDAFMKGFEKEAFLNLGGALNKGIEYFNTADKGGNAFKEGLGSGLGRAAATLAVGLAGAAIANGINAARSTAGLSLLRNKFESALDQVIANNRVVKGAKPGRAKEYGETIFKFAPHVACDPNLLGAVLANAVLGEGLDPITVKNLLDLETRYQESIAPSPIQGIR